MNHDFENRLRATLASYGITDVTVIYQGTSKHDGSEMVTVLTGDTDRIDVAEMIAKEILERHPVWMSVGHYGAGKEFRYAGWPGCGGAAFGGYIGSRRSFALQRYQMARATASNLEAMGSVIEADKIYDLARAAYNWECELADKEEREVA